MYHAIPRPAIDAIRALIIADVPMLDRAVRAAQERGGDIDDLLRWSACVQATTHLLLLASEPPGTEGTVLVHDRLTLALMLLRDVISYRLSPLDTDRVPALAPPTTPCALPAPTAFLVIQTVLVGVLAAIQTGAQAVAVLLETDTVGAEQGYPDGIRWRIMADAPGIAARRIMAGPWQDLEHLLTRVGGTMTTQRTDFTDTHHSWEICFWAPPPVQMWVSTSATAAA